MKPPIITNNSQHFAGRGDVNFYNSVEALLGYIEIDDVLNEEYIVYDSAGYLLKLEVYDVPKRKTQSIRVIEPAPPIQVAGALRDLLIEYLDYVIEARRTEYTGFWKSILIFLGIASRPQKTMDRQISKERLDTATLDELISIAFELDIVRE